MGDEYPGLERLTEQEQSCFLDCQATQAYISGFSVQNIHKLPSRWRPHNLVLRIQTQEKDFVFKYISQEKETAEIQKVQLLHEHYDGYLPDVHVYGKRTYLMDFVKGEILTDLLHNVPDERLPQIAKHVANSLTTILHSYKGKPIANCDGFPQIGHTLHEYAIQRGFLKNKFTKEEWKRLNAAMPAWIPVLEGYTGQTIHNDLNTDNVLVTADGIRAIDPGFAQDEKDVTKDLARTSMTFINQVLERKEPSLEKAISTCEIFLENVHLPYETTEQMLPRLAFYIAQTHLSFSQFEPVYIPAHARRMIALEMFEDPVYRSVKTSKELLGGIKSLFERAVREYGLAK
jgi:serine/threonine protein kinase